MKKMLFLFNPRSGKEQIKGHLLRILELQPQGGRRMAAADYLRGHPLQVEA